MARIIVEKIPVAGLCGILACQNCWDCAGTKAENGAQRRAIRQPVVQKFLVLQVGPPERINKHKQRDGRRWTLSFDKGNGLA